MLRKYKRLNSYNVYSRCTKLVGSLAKEAENDPAKIADADMEVLSDAAAKLVLISSSGSVLPHELLLDCS